MSRSGLAFGAQLANELNPINFARAQVAFQQAAQIKQQRESFSRLQDQHALDFRTDPEYRKNFNAAQKRDPNALVSLKNLSQARGQVGVMRENIAVADGIIKRVNEFANTAGRDIPGFNPKFISDQIEGIKARIRANPEGGAAELFQFQGFLTQAMQKHQLDQVVNQFEQSVADLPIDQRLTELDRFDQMTPAQKKDLEGKWLRREVGLGTLANQRIAAQGKGFNSAETDFAARANTAETSTPEGERKFNDELNAAVKNRTVRPENATKIRAITAESSKRAADAAATERKEAVRISNTKTLSDLVFDEEGDTSEASVKKVVEGLSEEKKMSLMNVTSIGDANVKIEEARQGIIAKKAEAQANRAEGEVVLDEFKRQGGVTNFQGSPMVIADINNPGALVIVTKDQGAKLPLHREVPSQAKGATGNLGDDEVLFGSDGQGFAFTPSLDSRREEGSFNAVFDIVPIGGLVKAGEQLVVQADSATGVAKLALLKEGVDAEGNPGKGIDQSFNAQKWAEAVVKDNMEGNRFELMDGTLNDAGKAIRATARKFKAKGKKQEFISLADQVDTLREALLSQSAKGGAAPIKGIQEFTGTDEQVRDVAFALVKLYQIYGKYNLAASNRFAPLPLEVLEAQAGTGAGLGAGAGAEVDEVIGDLPVSRSASAITSSPLSEQRKESQASGAGRGARRGGR